MTTTIELPSDTLATLQADAAAQGRPVEALAAEHLAALYAADEDTVEDAVNDAFAQLDAGQDEPFEPFAEELRARYFGKTEGGSAAAPGKGA